MTYPKKLEFFGTPTTGGFIDYNNPPFGVPLIIPHPRMPELLLFNNPLVGGFTALGYGPVGGQAVDGFSLHNAAQYRCLSPHWLNNQTYDTGSLIVEAVDVPIGWVPTLAVDPLNMRAVNAFYAAGPRGRSYEDLNLWATAPRIQPATSWVRQGPFYVLTGLGAGLAPIGES